MTKLTISTYPWVITDAQALLDENEKLRKKVKKLTSGLDFQGDLAGELGRLRNALAFAMVELSRAENLGLILVKKKEHLFLK